MFDILTLIPGKKRRTAKGWFSFNAVCCQHRGHKSDQRSRGGIKFDGEHNWSYHCFNCDFKCGFTLGKTLSANTKKLLSWCGIDQDQISAWNLYSLKNKDLIDVVTHKKIKHKIKFNETELPENAELLDVAKHQRYIEYLTNRGISYTDYPYMVTPDEEGRNSNRIIVPYTYKQKIVGYTSRYLDNRIPKYIKEQQTGYVFGYDLQKSNWEVCLVFEGIFDALTFSGCALTHDTISDEQADLLRTLHRRIIIVPDQDKTGLNICERALELGFQVSLPDWGVGIKDANDAALKYGKLPTLLSILQAATNNKVKIELARRRIDKRI